MITLFNAASTAPISQPFTVVKQVTVYATGLVFGDEIQFETVTYAEAPPSAQDQGCCDTPTCSPCIPNPGQIVTGTARLTCCGCSCASEDYPIRLTADTPFIIIEAPQNVYIRAVYIGGNLGDFNIWTEQTETANVTDGMRGCCHPPEVDIAVEKTTQTTTPRVGEATSYTITVTNSGPAAANKTIVKDVIPADMTVTGITVAYANGAIGAATLTPAQLAGGYEIPIFPANGAATITVAGSFATVGAYLNRVAVFEPEGTVDIRPENNESEVLINVKPNVSDVSVSKTVSNPTPRVGEPLTYTVTAANSGPQDANGMLLIDTLPVGFTPTSLAITYTGGGAGPASATPAALATGVALTTMPAGATAVLTITGSFSAVGSYENNAAVKPPAGRADSDTLNNAASVAVAVIANVADVSVTKTSSNSAPRVGEALTYTVTATNAGPQDADGMLLIDALPPSFTSTSIAISYTGGGAGPVTATPAELVAGVVLTTMPAGATAVLTITGSFSTIGTYLNSAAVKPPTGREDPDTLNNEATASSTVVANMADVSVSKTAGAEAYDIGDTVTYTVTFGNAGPQDADGAVLTDVLPSTLTGATVAVVFSGGASSAAPTPASLAAGWAIATLPAGGGGVLTITGVADVAGVITNQVQIAAPAGRTDPNVGNNSAVVVTAVRQPLDTDVCGDPIDPATAQYFVKGNLMKCVDGEAVPLECGDIVVTKTDCDEVICQTAVRMTNPTALVGAGVCVDVQAVGYDSFGLGVAVLRGRDLASEVGVVANGGGSGAHLQYTHTNDTTCPQLLEARLVGNGNLAYWGAGAKVSFVYNIGPVLNITMPGTSSNPLLPNFATMRQTITAMAPNTLGGVPGISSYQEETVTGARHIQVLQPGETLTLYAQWWAVLYASNPMPGLIPIHGHMGMDITVYENGAYL